MLKAGNATHDRKVILISLFVIFSGFKMTKFLLATALFCSVISLVLVIIGITTNYWVDDNVGFFNMGLWRFCIKVGKIKCFRFGDTKNITGSEWQGIYELLSKYIFTKLDAQ